MEPSETTAMIERVIAADAVVRARRGEGDPGPPPRPIERGER